MKTLLTAILLTMTFNQAVGGDKSAEIRGTDPSAEIRRRLSGANAPPPAPLWFPPPRPAIEQERPKRSSSENPPSQTKEGTIEPSVYGGYPLGISGELPWKRLGSDPRNYRPERKHGRLQESIFLEKDGTAKTWTDGRPAVVLVPVLKDDKTVSLLGGWERIDQNKDNIITFKEQQRAEDGIIAADPVYPFLMEKRVGNKLYLAPIPPDLAINMPDVDKNNDGVVTAQEVEDHRRFLVQYRKHLINQARRPLGG